MKRIIAGIILLIALSIPLRISRAIVTDIENDVVTVVTPDGHEWEFYGNGYEKGSEIRVTFYTNCTHNIEDDSIIKTR